MKSKTIRLTDTDGHTADYTIRPQLSEDNPGWQVSGDGIDRFVPITDVCFPTPTNIVAAAYFDPE